MGVFKKSLNKIASKLILIPYHWYIAIKSIPSFVHKLTYRKPTNKEFIQRYNNWLKKQSRLSVPYQKTLEEQEWLPDFAILIAISPKHIDYLDRTLQSLRDGSFSFGQVILCFVGVDKKEAEQFSDRCELFKDGALKISSYLAINEAEAFNQAFLLVQSDYFMCIKSGDVIEPQCLTFVVKEIVNKPTLDIIYFDEGKVSSKGIKHIPKFKPKWSPDLLLSFNYLGSGVVFCSSIFKSVGGFDSSFYCSYLYDVLLRLMESTDNISHISEVLFHKRSSSERGDKIEEELIAIKNALERRNEVAKVVVKDGKKGIYHIRYQLNEESKISIIIPSRDQGEILDNCLASIYEKTSYRNYELIIVDNGSTEDEFFDVIKKWKRILTVELKVLVLDIPFSFSRINNLAVEEATGDYLLFLNNDVEVLSTDWLSGMLEQAQRSSIGAVGAKLLFPNNEIQHAGVFLGVDGISSHPFAKNTEEDSHYYVNSIVNYSVLTGACLMMKKSIFEEVEGFDEDFVIEFNDFDLCLKLVNAGYHNVYLPHVVLYHYESYSRGKKHNDVRGFMRYRNERSLFLERWGEYIENDPSYNSNLHKDSDQIFQPRLD